MDHPKREESPGVSAVPGGAARGDAPSPAPLAGAAPRARSPMGVIFLTLFLDLAGFSIIFPLSPSLLEHYLKLEGNEGLLGTLVSSLNSLSPYASAQPVYTAALFGGVLGSIYSLLQILIISNAGIALSYLLWAASGSFGLFIASRFLAGAMGGNISVATAAAADASTRENRAKAMGMVGAAFGLGFIFGPAIGGYLHRFDLTRSLPALTPYGLNPFSAAALGAFGLSLLSVLWTATRFTETLPPELRGRARQERTINPLRFFQRFEFPGVRAVNVITFLYLLAFAGMEFTLTFLARERFQYEPEDNVGFFVFVGLIMVLVQGGLVRRLAPRFGERALAVAGLLTVVPGFIVMGLASNPRTLYIGLGFMGLGSGLVQPSTTSLISLYTPPDRQGAVLGIFRSLGSFARAVGPLLATLVFFRFGSAWPYYLGALVLIPPLAMVVRLPDPRRGSSSPSGR
jgi:MFS family permease